MQGIGGDSDDGALTNPVPLPLIAVTVAVTAPTGAGWRWSALDHPKPT
jgi:hypothetical protein